MSDLKDALQDLGGMLAARMHPLAPILMVPGMALAGIGAFLLDWP